MRLYRITPEKHLQDFNGLGASYQDGARWNLPGQPALYFALSASTALLEMGHYLPSPTLIPKNYRLGIYELPDDSALDSLQTKQLPDNWAQYPYPASTQYIGSEWLENSKALGLRVPSSAVPQGLDKILLINPQHKNIRHLRFIDSTAELYNRRLFSGI